LSVLFFSTFINPCLSPRDLAHPRHHGNEPPDRVSMGMVRIKASS
jgi:hypothetical protein